VPIHGTPYQPAQVASTWTITLSQATGPVPLSLHEFNSLDHLGNIFWPTYLAGQPPLPQVLRPGETVSFRVRAYETVGEGIMRWAPIDQKIVAMWDFTVETD